MVRRQLCLPSLSYCHLSMGVLACGEVYVVRNGRKKLGEDVWVICLRPGGSSRTEMGIIIYPPLSSAKLLTSTHFNFHLMQSHKSSVANSSNLSIILWRDLLVRYGGADVVDESSVGWALPWLGLWPREPSEAVGVAIGNILVLSRIRLDHTFDLDHKHSPPLQDQLVLAIPLPHGSRIAPFGRVSDIF